MERTSSTMLSLRPLSYRKKRRRVRDRVAPVRVQTMTLLMERGDMVTVQARQDIQTHKTNLATL